MECGQIVEAATARLSGELRAAGQSELARHLDDCAACRAEEEKIRAAWDRLGDDPDVAATAAFRRATLEIMELETLRRRVRRLTPRRRLIRLAEAAAVLVAGAAGFLAARRIPIVAATPQTPRVWLAADRTIDGTRTIPDLSGRPRLSNVAYRPADATGRMAISFDVATHYTMTGRPSDRGVVDLLAYLMSSNADTEGARGQAIELVSQHFKGDAVPSPQVVDVLIRTLRADRNPGVRKKAAEALSQMRPTPQIRDAFVAALKHDGNPAIRIIAVDALARAAATTKDPRTIETLREKATDERETGFVRVKAASALKKISL
jgi:HEAT repeats